jgi:hypothetical protein
MFVIFLNVRNNLYQDGLIDTYWKIALKDIIDCLYLYKITKKQVKYAIQKVKKNEQKSISISELEYFEKRIGVDVGYNDNLPHHDYSDSKKGYDKNLQLEEIIKLAKDINGNIIIKAGKNANGILKKLI